MNNEIVERNVNTSYGVFHFELVDYPGPSPLVDISLNATHLGWANYVNLSEASDLDLLNLANSIEYPSEE